MHREGYVGMSKEEILNMIIEQQKKKSPSEQFTTGPIFDIFRNNRDVFLQAVETNDAFFLQTCFVKSYSLFLANPEVVGFTTTMVNKDNNDTDTRTWNADSVSLPEGDYAALLYMPIQHDTLAARIVGILFSDKGDGYYYCMLNKDEGVPSEVFRNKAILGIEKVGSVKGFGFELMDSFLDCIQHDYYQKT